MTSGPAPLAIRDRKRLKNEGSLLKSCIGSGLLILDDFAFLSYSQADTEPLYAICDESLAEGSSIVTSNRPLEDWFSAFPDAIVVGAVMVRLVAEAVKLIITSVRSYRKEDRSESSRKLWLDADLGGDYVEVPRRNRLALGW